MYRNEEIIDGLERVREDILNDADENDIGKTGIEKLRAATKIVRNVDSIDTAIDRIRESFTIQEIVNILEEQRRKREK